MNKFTIFFISLLLCSAASCTSVSGAFETVSNAITSFRDSIRTERDNEQTRYETEKKWCENNISKAKLTLASRQHDVDEVKSHIKYLDNERTESIKDMKTRQARIATNLANLKKFKKQRCDNNLLFVKALREHMEGIKVLQLLKGDITQYFAKFNKKDGPKKANSSFIERFEEFSHLLNEENSEIFAQLKKDSDLLTHKEINSRNTEIESDVAASVAHKSRTSTQIGTGHVDNKKGQLKELKAPGFEDKAKYRKDLQVKVMNMINHLIKHLRTSRKTLTKDEVHAAEDFAIYQTNIAKENRHLKKTIEKLKVHIAELVRKLAKARVQLKHRVKLLNIAQSVLDKLVKVCKEKEEYHAAQVRRFKRELTAVKEAIELFNTLLKNISKRVKSRTNSNVEGKDYKEGMEDTDEVTSVESNTNVSLNKRVDVRHEIVFPQFLIKESM